MGRKAQIYLTAIFQKQISVELEKVELEWCKKFPSVFVSYVFLHLKTDFIYSSSSFVRLSSGRTTDKLTINWQNFAQVGLQLKVAFRIRP